MTTSTTTSLSRLAEEWPGWSSLLERRVAPELMQLLDTDRIRVEEIHEDGALLVRAELPGVDPDKDIEVTATDGVLQIRAHREHREHVEEDGRNRTEFRYGSFLRQLALPTGAVEDDVTATYHDGILEVRVPMGEQAEEPAPTRISVTRT